MNQKEQVSYRESRCGSRWRFENRLDVGSEVTLERTGTGGDGGVVSGANEELVVVLQKKRPVGSVQGRDGGAGLDDAHLAVLNLLDGERILLCDVAVHGFWSGGSTTSFRGKRGPKGKLASELFFFPALLLSEVFFTS